MWTTGGNPVCVASDNQGSKLDDIFEPGFEQGEGVFEHNDGHHRKHEHSRTVIAYLVQYTHFSKYTLLSHRHDRFTVDNPFTRRHVFHFLYDNANCSTTSASFHILILFFVIFYDR